MTTPKSLESVSVTIPTSTAEIIQGIRTKTNLGLEIKDFTYVKKLKSYSYQQTIYTMVVPL